MNQPPHKSPRSRYRSRSQIAMSPRQFVAIVAGMAIAIVIGGIWLIRSSLRPPTAVVESNQNSETLTPTENTDNLDPRISNANDEEAGNNQTITLSPQIWRSGYDAEDPLPRFQNSLSLKSLIQNIQQLAEAESLPLESMSVVLIDLNQQAVASYQPDQFHYPASIAKLFWLVAFYGQVEQGLLNPNDYLKDLTLMIQESDNNATSRIIDAITRTTTSLSPESTIPTDFETWLGQRQQLNGFFKAAKYNGLNITQKTYPITDVEIMEPVGFDLKMRENPQNPDKPIRNRLTAYQAARLMAEIAAEEAIAPKASQQMLKLLARDLSQDWQSPKDYFNPVQYFFGEGLPQTTQLYSKAGWTSQGRHEVAYIVSNDGQKEYILSIFADHPSYAENQTFFPAVAKLVNEQI